MAAPVTDFWSVFDYGVFDDLVFDDPEGGDTYPKTFIECPGATSIGIGCPADTAISIDCAGTTGIATSCPCET